ncbi:MAG: hypothetical protein A2Z02_04235 [Chloroflexi bacterium RBG_16_48_7]|nr:MAG: hypothetical protein A2Z02_04235 [Chloroflexi bacterium RBG_16_48_7]
MRFAAPKHHIKLIRILIITVVIIFLVFRGVNRSKCSKKESGTGITETTDKYYISVNVTSSIGIALYTGRERV